MAGMLFDNIQLLPIKYPRCSRYFERYLEIFASLKILYELVLTFFSKTLVGINCP
jgi:hypothetical protein